MLFLALYPILGYYTGPAGLTYANIVTIILIVISFFKKPGISLNVYPKYYLIFWTYAALALIFTVSSMKITFLIPGGISFFLWSLALGLTLRYFDFSTLKKYLYLVFILSSVVLIAQEVMIFFTGSRFIAFLPLSEELSIGANYSEWKQVLLSANRSSSFFSEPSYFALYSLPVLAIELFYENDKKKVFTPLSFYIITVLLILRSGVGLIGIALLVFIKLVTFIKGINIKKILTFIVFFTIIIFVAKEYFSSKIGQEMLERTAEFDSESSSAYLRLIRGYLVYDYLPWFNKIFGIWPDDLLKMNIPYFDMTQNKSSILYFNGLQTALIRIGIIGVLILITVYFNLYKNNTALAKVLIWTFLLLALLDQMYMSTTMLIFTSIAAHFHIKNKNKRFCYEENNTSIWNPSRGNKNVSIGKRVPQISK